MSFTDYDGNTYNTVTINSAVWARKNLLVTHFRDGTAITNVTNLTPDQRDVWFKGDTPAYCYYQDSSAFGTIYGCLYNYAAVASSKHLAPTSYHVATNAEWTALATYLGASTGGILKSTGDTYWEDPNTGATNAQTFDGLPGGFRDAEGDYDRLGQSADFWTATADSADGYFDRGFAYSRSIVFDSATIKSTFASIACGMSVRVVHD